MFCPECGSILRVKEKAKKRILCCGNCSYTKTPEEGDKMKVSEKVNTGKKVEVVENINIYPKVRATCSKCGNDQAYYWTQQTRSADEPETRFFKCTKCNHTWREYA